MVVSVLALGAAACGPMDAETQRILELLEAGFVPVGAPAAEAVDPETQRILELLEAGFVPVGEAAGSAPAAAGDDVTPGTHPHLFEDLGEFDVYCYHHGGLTASGEPVSEDVVAVDPDVIPLWTRIYIEDVGWRTALDTGGGIKENKLDIWNPSRSFCWDEWGVRTKNVWVPVGEM